MAIQPLLCNWSKMTRNPAHTRLSWLNCGSTTPSLSRMASAPETVSLSQMKPRASWITNMAEVFWSKPPIIHRWIILPRCSETIQLHLRHQYRQHDKASSCLPLFPHWCRKRVQIHFRELHTEPTEVICRQQVQTGFWVMTWDYNHNLIVNLEQAKLFKRIYGMFLTGQSPFQIAWNLTKEWLPSPGGKHTSIEAAAPLNYIRLGSIFGYSIISGVMISVDTKNSAEALSSSLSRSIGLSWSNR